MQNIDIKYITDVMGNLSGIPIRIYKNHELFHYYSIVYLPKDPIVLYLDELFAIKENIGYYITPKFNYYGIVNCDIYSIIIGPTRLLPSNDQEFRDLAFELELTKEQTTEFVSGMKNIINIPLDSIMQMMAVLNYMLNNEKRSIKELAIQDLSQDKIKEEFETKKTSDNFKNNDITNNSFQHNTLSIEEQLMGIVTKGNTKELKEWMDQAPAIRGGQLASNDLRHLKNTFIVSTTLASRAAIRGGLSIEEALSLSDAYIQRCEILQSFSDVYNLQYRMIFDYTERVEKIKIDKITSKLCLEVLNYINRHLSEPINTQKMADELFISRSGLSTKFKQETGQTLTEFIMKTKLDEAMNLLRYTDKSILTISEYLGFSSQSHFNNTFIKYKKMTPNEYRKDIKNKLE